MVRILAFSGSMRVESLNTRLVRIAAEGARRAGADVTLMELRDYPMPVYDGDLEAREGLPENAKALKAVFGRHDGFLISSPENNSSFSAALKNTIDWVSRKESADEPSIRDLSGRTAAIMSASPGALGGLRGLYPLRLLLTQINITVIPDQRAISGANGAFNDDGSLKNARDHEAVFRVGTRLAEVTAKLKG